MQCRSSPKRRENAGFGLQKEMLCLPSLVESLICLLHACISLFSFLSRTKVSIQKVNLKICILLLNLFDNGAVTEFEHFCNKIERTSLFNNM